MSLISFKHDQASVLLRVKILDSSVTTGAGKTGLTSASSGLIISTIADNEATATAYTVAASNVETITTLGTYAAPTAGKCRFKEVDSTNHKGVYEIQIADARFAVSSAKSLLISISGATDAAECDALVPLTQVDPYDAVRGGMTALPNVAEGVATAAAIRAEIDTNSTQLAAIVADTNELQTDWADGGRLDLILGARASQASVDTIDANVDAILVDTAEIGAAGAGLTAIPDMATATNQATIAGYIDTEVGAIKTVVDAILVDTAEIGAAGAGLTAIPWNAAWDAEVQSEVDDALDAFVCDTGVGLAKLGEIVAALAAGQVTVNSVGGVSTMTYKKRDGTTTSFTTVVTEADKTRATTGALS